MLFEYWVWLGLYLMLIFIFIILNRGEIPLVEVEHLNREALLLLGILEILIIWMPNIESEASPNVNFSLQMNLIT